MNKSVFNTIKVFFASFLLIFSLVGCGVKDETTSSESSDTTSSETTSEKIIFGTTDPVTVLDPVANYDNPSMVVYNNTAGFLLAFEAGSSIPVPSLAESAEFTDSTHFTVKLKSGLTFANGNPLTSSDVKFTFARQLKVQHENGPSSLLGSLDFDWDEVKTYTSVDDFKFIETPDDTTVVFVLKEETANDVTFPYILTTAVAPIVDEDVYLFDDVTPNETIVSGKGFAGPYVLDSFQESELIEYSPNAAYAGLESLKAQNAGVTEKTYADASNLKIAIQQGEIDVAYRSIKIADLEDLRNDSNVQVIDGPGGELRYMVFNFHTMPYGESTENADKTKATAVRQAIASIVDREALSTQIYNGSYEPNYSPIPYSFEYATEPFKELYGDGTGKPSVDKAKDILASAGISDTELPIAFTLEYNGDHYGELSADEYNLIKTQLNDSGLFDVTIEQTEWASYSDHRANTEEKDGTFPVYQLGWFPDFPDADNYLSVFFATGNFLANSYYNETVDDLVNQEKSELDTTKRAQILSDLQAVLAEDISTLPLLTGKQVAVTGTNVSGLTLDMSFSLYLGSIVKS